MPRQDLEDRLAGFEYALVAAAKQSQRPLLCRGRAAGNRDVQHLDSASLAQLTERLRSLQQDRTHLDHGAARLHRSHQPALPVVH
jgi:hypothetical protein